MWRTAEDPKPAPPPSIDIARVCEAVVIAGLSAVVTKFVEYVYERQRKRDSDEKT